MNILRPLRNISLIIYLLVGSIIGTIFPLIIYYTDIYNKILIMGILICIICIYILIKRYKRVEYIDIFSIFTFIFSMYNGLILIQLGIDLRHDENIFITTFSDNTYMYASLLTLIAICGLFIGELIFSKKINIKKSKYIINEKINTQLLCFVGNSTYILGIICMLINYSRIGGIKTVLTMDRGLRLQILSQVSFNIPYQIFIFVGITLSYVSFKLSKSFKMRVISYIQILIWISLMLLEGDRRFLIYSVFILMGLFLTLNDVNYKKIFTFKNIFVIIILYIVFCMFAQVRWVIPMLIKGDMNVLDSILWIKSNFDIEWILPLKNEFSGPYFTLLYSIENNNQDYIGGFSYIQSISNLIPRSLYPGIKPPTISQEFANDIHNLYTYYRSSVVGFGYNPIAEAYRNFGLVGPFIVFFLISLIFQVIEKIKLNNVKTICIYGLIINIAFSLNRTSFSGVFQEVIFSIIIFYISWCIYKILYKIYNK